MVAISTTLPAVTKGSASALVKKKRTSGSVPVWKSVSTLAFHSSLEVAEASRILLPVAASKEATAFS